MREIVLDTETTGISAADGHRIIEIGALELVNHTPTGNNLHLYINPERDIEDGAFAVHGISPEFLADKPVFADIAEQFMEFVGDDQMVIHNASFDMAFINAELARLALPEYPMSRAVDTLAMARKKFPGAQANLNALCRRFEIDNSHRDLHGALVDADLLTEVYIELLGGRQPDLSLDDTRAEQQGQQSASETLLDQSGFSIQRDAAQFSRPHMPTDAELSAHKDFLEKIEDPIWKQ
jgi:DNA polymerase-3 subunit epsilon